MRGDRRLFSGLDFQCLPEHSSSSPDQTAAAKPVCSGSCADCSLRPKAQVKWQGANIRSLGEEYFTSVTYLGHRHGVKDELSAVENLRISNALNGIEISKERARDVLEQMGLAGRELLPARLLSEGQRRRVALARLLVCNTKLWLLDEVMTSLDKGAVALVRSLIENHLAGGGIAIVATHQELELSAGLTKRLELTT